MTVLNSVLQSQLLIPSNNQIEVDATMESKDKVKEKAAFRTYCQKNDQYFNCGEEGHKQPSCMKPKASIAAMKTKKWKYEYNPNSENK